MEREVLPLPWSESRLSEGINRKKKSKNRNVFQLSRAKPSHQAWRQCRLSAHVARQWCVFSPSFTQNLEMAQPIRQQHYVTWLKQQKLENLTRANVCQARQLPQVSQCCFGEEIAECWKRKVWRYSHPRAFLWKSDAADHVAEAGQRWAVLNRTLNKRGKGEKLATFTKRFLQYYSKNVLHSLAHV